MQSYVVKRQVLQLRRKTSKSPNNGSSKNEGKSVSKHCTNRKEKLQSQFLYPNGNLEIVRHFNISKKGKINSRRDSAQYRKNHNELLDDKLEYEEIDSLMPTNCFSVAVYGAPETGRTSLIHQMSTSGSVEGYDLKDVAKTVVPVVLDDKQTRIKFSECDSYLRYSSSFTNNDAFLMVYSLTDRRSFQCVVAMVKKLRNTYRCTKPIILVCNKSDLIRCRSMRMEDGKLLAREYNCKYIETSVPLKWRVDDVLVAVTKQLQLYSEFQPNATSNLNCNNESNSASEKRPPFLAFFRRRIFRSKMTSIESCENIFKLKK